MGLTAEHVMQLEVFDFYTKAFDYDGSNNLIYAGRAMIGSVKSANVWQIKKLVYVGTNVVDVLWASNGSSTNIWDDRASLSYS